MKNLNGQQELLTGLWDNMKKKLEEYLYKKYPKLFENHSKPMTESCMYWGCSHGDGWFFLLDNLRSTISNYIDAQHSSVDYYDNLEKLGVKYKRPEHALEKIEPVVFDQVKEKVGSLRIYYTGGDDEIQSMIRFTEKLSESICENCGKFDHSVGRTTVGWVRTICKECCSKDKKWKQTDVELENLFKS